MEPEKKKEKKRKSKIKISTAGYSFLIVFIFYFIFIGISVYFFPNFENIIIKKTTQIIPYPAVIIDYDFITLKDLSENLASVQKFYENQDFSDLGLRVDFKTEDGKKRLHIKKKEVLQKLIDNKIIELEANKRGIVLTKELIDQEVDRKLKEYGTTEYLKENLERLYGWDIDKFKEKIVKPDLYKEKLFEKIKKEDDSYAKAQKKAEKIENKLKNGEDFSILAEEYSDGESAKQGGRLGWFSYDQMLPEIALEVFHLEKGETSEIIESSIGYHIVKVEDRKNENEIELVDVSQIFIKTESFSDWLMKIEKNYKILILNNEFDWNKNESELRFRDQEMIKYEKKLFESETNDPSIIF